MDQQPVALVTGASRGIGRALALGLAADGYRVAAAARSADQLVALGKEAGLPASRFLPLTLDMADADAIPRAVEAIIREFGRIDLVANNAGLGVNGTLEVPFDTFQQLMAVNLAGPFRLLQEVVPHMLKAKSGTIINVASRAGKIGFAGFGAYAASKFALVGLTESLYRELAPQGIRVTALCPSWVDTQMAQESGTPLPSQEMIRPEDLMKTIRWILSLSPAACVREVMIECRGNIE